MLFDVGDDNAQNIAVNVLDAVDGLVQFIVGGLLLTRYQKGAGGFAAKQQGICHHVDGWRIDKDVVIMFGKQFQKLFHVLGA